MLIVTTQYLKKFNFSFGFPLKNSSALYSCSVKLTIDGLTIGQLLRKRLIFELSSAVTVGHNTSLQSAGSSNMILQVMSSTAA